MSSDTSKMKRNVSTGFTGSLNLNLHSLVVSRTKKLSDYKMKVDNVYTTFDKV